MELNKKICRFISEEAKRQNLAEYKILPFNKNIIATQIAQLIPQKADTTYPEYLKSTWNKRLLIEDSYLGWVKSALIVAVDSHNIPSLKFDLPQSANFAVSGLVAGYASQKNDYHLHLSEILANFAKGITQLAEREVKTEISVDTKPVAEKALAFISGLGTFGKNTCVNVSKHGCGTFIGILFTDLKYPDTKSYMSSTENTSNPLSHLCNSCNLCIEACPTGALNPQLPGTFKHKLCRCHLNIEKKTELSDLERKLLGNWVFACDLCISSCPHTNAEKPIELDLEWLLLGDDKKIKKLVDFTTMKFPGLKKLRKNAVAVLLNKALPDSHKLLKKYKEKIKNSFSS